MINDTEEKSNHQAQNIEIPCNLVIRNEVILFND